MNPVAGRLFLLGIAVFVSLVFFLPSTPLFSAMPEWWKQHLPNKGITLGLDLQGGIHLVLEVEAERAIEIKLDRDVTTMTELFAKKKLQVERDRKSTRLNSSHSQISYAVFCLKKKKRSVPRP